MPVFQQSGDSQIVSISDTDQRITLPSLPSDNPAIRLVNIQAAAPGSDFMALWLKLGGAAVSGSKTTSMLVRPGSILHPLILGVGTATHLSVFADGGGTGDMLLTPGRIVEGAATGATGEAAGLGFIFDDGTSMADPGSGILRFDNATVASVSNIAVDDNSRDGVDVSAYLTAFDDSTSTVKGHVIITVANDPSKIAIFQVDSLTDNSGWVQLGVTHIASDGTIANDDEIQVEFRPKGDKGDTGSTGADGVHPGLKFAFDNSTSMADPGSGDFRLNNGTLSSVTAAAVSDNSADTGNPDVSAAVLAWDDSDSAVRGTLRIKKVSAPENSAIYQIDGASTDNSGWTQLSLSYVDHAGSFSDTDECVLEFSRTGDKGDKGDKGGQGDPGEVTSTGTSTAGNLASFTDTTADEIQDSGVASSAVLLSGDIGSTVQAWDAGLDDISGLTPSDSNFIVGDGSNWVAESGNTARTSLGLGTGDSPQFSGLNVSGGGSDVTVTANTGGTGFTARFEATETGGNNSAFFQYEAGNNNLELGTISGSTDFVAVRVARGSTAVQIPGTIDLSNYIDLSEIATPADPAADTARLYAKDDAGTTKLFFRDNAGTETDISGSGGGSVDRQVFTSSGTWNKPVSGTVALIEVWAGGGGGGDSIADGGGGGGAYNYAYIPLSDLGSSETVTVGAGGGTNTAGGTSSFGTHVQAFGGGFGDTAGGGGGGGQLSAGGDDAGAGGTPFSGAAGIGSGAGAESANCGGGGNENDNNDGHGGDGLLGGGGGGADLPTNTGGDSLYGGGGGAGEGGGNGTGGSSIHAGDGGDVGVAGTAPAGGGGQGASGARGEVRMTVW